MNKIVLVLLGILFFSFSSNNYILKYGKKINKEIKRIFKDENLKINKFSLSDPALITDESSFYQIESSDKVTGYIYINRVNACITGGCDRPGLLQTVRYDHFYYMAVFDIDLSILKLTILDYQSDHGYEICSKNWLNQFKGNSDRVFVYNKNVDAISGATVSVNALIDEINILTDQLPDFTDRNY